MHILVTRGSTIRLQTLLEAPLKSPYNLFYQNKRKEGTVDMGGGVAGRIGEREELAGEKGQPNGV